MLFRSICDSDSGPRRDTDRCVLRLNDSTITCLPLGDGQKIRGQRANDIIADEFASIPREIFENVVAGFAAVSADPVENVKRLAAKQKAIELGVDIESENNSEEKTLEYADWSIKQFLEMASKEKWFRNTIFLFTGDHGYGAQDRKSTRLNSSHVSESRMPSSA